MIIDISNLIPFRSKRAEIERAMTEAIHNRKVKTWLKQEDLQPAITTAWMNLPEGSTYEEVEYEALHTDLVCDARDGRHGFTATSRAKMIVCVRHWHEYWNIEHAFNINMIECKDGFIECPAPKQNRRLVSQRILMEEMV